MFNSTLSKRDFFLGGGGGGLEIGEISDCNRNFASEIICRCLNCSDRILAFGIRNIRSPAKVGLVVTELLITNPVVSWRDPPPRSTAAQLSFFAQPPLSNHLSLCVDCLRDVLFTFGGGLVSSTLTKMSIIFFLFFLLAMSYFLFTYVRGLVTPPSF